MTKLNAELDLSREGYITAEFWRLSMNELQEGFGCNVLNCSLPIFSESLVLVNSVPVAIVIFTFSLDILRSLAAGFSKEGI